MATSCCRFDPQQMAVWLEQTGLCFFSDTEREEIYLSAHPFLHEQMKELLQDGWLVDSTSEKDKDVLFHIYKPSGAQFILPQKFESFLDPSKADTWKSIFETPDIFTVQLDEQKDEEDHPDPYLANSSRPLIDIFYLIQVLAPGMLTIQIEYYSDDVWMTASRALPRPDWISENLARIGGTRASERIDVLVLAAKDEETAFLEAETGQSSWDRDCSPNSFDEDYFCSESYYYTDDDDEPILDLTACDKECGYCGKCEY